METTTENVIEQLESRISDECSTVDREQRFCDMIDECYSFEQVGGIFATMTPSRVLREMDPTAYRCGMSDFEDSENLVEIGGDYYDKDEAERVKEEFISEIESEADDAEECATHEEAERMEAEPEQYIEDKKQEAAALRAAVKALHKHPF